MQLLLKLTLILCFVAPTTPRGINQKQHPGFVPLGTAVLTRGETESYKNLRKIGDIENLAICKNEYIEVEPFNAQYMRGKKSSGIIIFMAKISVAENAPYGEYYAPVYYSTYTDENGRVHEDVGEIKIIVKEAETTPKYESVIKAFRNALGIIIVVLFGIVGLSMALYILVRILRSAGDSDIEEEESENEE